MDPMIESMRTSYRRFHSNCSNRLNNLLTRRPFGNNNMIYLKGYLALFLTFLAIHFILHLPLDLHKQTRIESHVLARVR